MLTQQLLPAQQPPSRATYNVNQPPYLTNNWRALQVSDDARYSNFVKVQGGIATITNGEAMLRCGISGVPDGFYVFNDRGVLVDSADELGYPSSFYSELITYPDPESVKPNFPMLEHTPPIPNVEVRKIVDFLTHVKTVVADPYRDINDSFVFFQESALVSCADPHVWVDVGCVIPVKPQAGFFRTNMLRLVLTDMLRYEYIFIGRDTRPIDPNVASRMPLVVGTDWSSCGLIKVRKHN